MKVYIGPSTGRLADPTNWSDNNLAFNQDVTVSGTASQPVTLTYDVADPPICIIGRLILVNTTLSLTGPVSGSAMGNLQAGDVSLSGASVFIITSGLWRVSLGNVFLNDTSQFYAASGLIWFGLMMAQDSSYISVITYVTGDIQAGPGTTIDLANNVQGNLATAGVLKTHFVGTATQNGVGGNLVVSGTWTADVGNSKVAGLAVFGSVRLSNPVAANVIDGTVAASYALVQSEGPINYVSGDVVINGSPFHVASSTSDTNAAVLSWLPGATALPSTPSNVQATKSGATVTISWNAVTGADWYNLYKGSTTGGESSTPYKIGISGTSTADGLTASVTSYYKVTAVNAGGESALSSEVSATG